MGNWVGLTSHDVCGCIGLFPWSVSDTQMVANAQSEEIFFVAALRRRVQDLCDLSILYYTYTGTGISLS